VGQQHATQHLYYFVFHLKVLAVIISIFPLKEQCAQWDELLDFFASFFDEDDVATSTFGSPSPDNGLMNESQKCPRIHISDAYLLQELISSLTSVCETFPFLKSKTAQFIQASFHQASTEDK
jgi:hypothetical protein